MVTPISTVLRAATGDCDPVYGRCRCGVPYYQKVTQSRRIFLRRSQDHRQFSIAVTWSQTVTPVGAAHIGATTPCKADGGHEFNSLAKPERLEYSHQS